LKELLALEAEDRVTETNETVERLETQHTEDARRLTELQTENATLRIKASEIRTVTLQDPEAASLRDKVLTLTAALKFVAENLGETAPQMAIRCIQGLTLATARLFCDLAGVDHSSYVQMLQTYRTEAELQTVIDKAQHDGPAVIFARAALALSTKDTLSKLDFVPLSPAPRDLQAEDAEALRRARMEMGIGTPRPVRVDGPKSAQENLEEQPFAYAGSTAAQQTREKVIPSYVQPQRQEISGGGDWSEWVP
jgi:hypothetical protein